MNASGGELVVALRGADGREPSVRCQAPSSLQGTVTRFGSPVPRAQVALVLRATGRSAKGAPRVWSDELPMGECADDGTFTCDAPAGPISFDGSLFRVAWFVAVDDGESRVEAPFCLAAASAEDDADVALKPYAFGTLDVPCIRTRTMVAPPAVMGRTAPLVAIFAPLLALSMAVFAVVKPRLRSIDGPVFAALVVMLAVYALAFRKRPPPPALVIALRLEPELSHPGEEIRVFLDGVDEASPAEVRCEEVLALYGGIERRETRFASQVPFVKEAGGWSLTFRLPEDANPSLALPEHAVRWLVRTTVAGPSPYVAEVEVRVAPRSA